MTWALSLTGGRIENYRATCYHLPAAIVAYRLLFHPSHFLPLWLQLSKPNIARSAKRGRRDTKLHSN